MDLYSIFHKNGKASRPVVIVSGLPRSGTSLMMQILQAGGIEILTDQIRTADKDNPKGYYEFERVKKLAAGDTRWVKDAQGKAVKVISALLENLPSGYTYKIIFMQRKIEEVLASQRQMLIRRGASPDKTSDATMANMFRKHLAEVTSWLDKQPNTQVLYILYDELLSSPQEKIQAVARFLDMPLNIESMLAVPDKTLYRQRA